MCGAAKYISCRRRGLGGIGCCWPSIFFEDWARRIRPQALAAHGIAAFASRQQQGATEGDRVLLVFGTTRL